MLTGVASGLNPRLLIDSVHNLLNLIPPKSHFWNALAHWPLSLSWQSIMKVKAPRTVKSSPDLLHWHIRSLINMSGLPRIRSHNKLGISCIHRSMERHLKRNQTTAFGSLWRTLIVWASLRKGTKINSLNKLCQHFNTNILYFGRMQNPSGLAPSHQQTNI
jgi:hypothetical protein